MQVALPVLRYPTRRTRDGLVGRMVLGRSKRRTVVELLVGVAPEPVLARLEAADERMSGLSGMPTRVLGRGGVATADVSALGTAAQVQPPSVFG
jgi:hypothetical protein